MMEKKVASRIELNGSFQRRGYIMQRIPSGFTFEDDHAENGRTLSGVERRCQAEPAE